MPRETQVEFAIDFTSQGEEEDADWNEVSKQSSADGMSLEKMTRYSHDNVRLFQISNVDAPCSLTISQETGLEVQSIAQFGDEETTQDNCSEKEPIGVSTWDAKNVRRCEDSEFE